MKNKILYSLIGILVLLAPSCSEDNDWLNPKPKDKMVFEDYWKNKNDVQAVVMSCYRALQEDDFMQRIILGGELRSDNVVEGRPMDTEHLRRILFANTLPNNPLVTWQPFYMVINYCNTVLAHAPDVMDIDPDFTPGILHAFEAEVLTIRALVYFYLVRLYKDVPYVTAPSSTDAQDFNVPQSTEAEILSYLVEDLKYAEKFAATVWTGNSQTKARITKDAVRALLADIYLWQGNYAECIAACDRIMDHVMDYETYQKIPYDDLIGNELMLVQPPVVNGVAQSFDYGWTYQEIFYMENSTESIFELRFDANQKNNDQLIALYGQQKNVYRGFLSSSPFDTWSDPGVNIPVFTRTDVRGKDSFLPEDAGYYWIFKYIGASRMNATGTGVQTARDYRYRMADDDAPNWIFYRLPDIFLMKAEALVETGEGNEEKLHDALYLVNRVYMRSNPELAARDSLSFATFSSKDRLANLVLLERQREFLFEGKRWFDLLRRMKRDNNTDVITSYVLRKFTSSAAIVGSKMSVMDAMYLPIHEDELISNPTLRQNPYYKSLIYDNKK